MRLRIIIIVRSARKLHHVQLMGKMNPLIQIECGETNVRTEVCRHGHDTPNFNQMLWLPLSTQTFDISECLIIKARHLSSTALSSKGSFIGKAKYPLERLASGLPTAPEWIRLVDRKGSLMGEVNMTFQLQTVNSIVKAPTRKSIQDFAPLKGYEPIPVCQLDIIEAKNLKRVAAWGQNSPFVHLKLGHLKANCDVARISRKSTTAASDIGSSPVWLQGISFPVCLDLAAVKRSHVRFHHEF